MKFMKTMFLLITLTISMNIFAWNDEYKFSHFQRLEDFDFQQVVLNNQQWSIVIFNRGYCSINDSMMDCFPYEMKLNALAPQLYARNNNIQIINMDTESTFTHQQFNLKSFPAVVFILNGQTMTTLEANRQLSYLYTQDNLSQFSWANNLLQRTLNEIYKISPSSK